jgi:hypothetical protein
VFHVTSQRCEHSFSTSLLTKLVFFLQCIGKKLKAEPVVIYVVPWQVFSKYVNKWIALACPFQGNFALFLCAFLFFGLSSKFKPHLNCVKFCCLNHKCKGALAFFSFILSFFQFYRCLNYIYA